MNVRPDIRNEEALLSGLCRMDFNPEQKAGLHELAGGIRDWRYFTALAGTHGVAALVYNNLEKLGFLQYLPAESSESLRNSLFASMSRNVRHVEMVKEALRVLKQESIKTVLLKGMALEHMVYGNSGLRQMTDADVLVAEEDCMRAWNVLIRNGFTSLPVKSVFHKLIIPYTGKHLPSLIRKDFSFEIHHDLFGKSGNELTKIFYDTSVEIDLSGERVFVPEPRIFFLYLIRHLNYHEMNNESQLRLYADLVVLIVKYGDKIINEELPGLAARAGMSEILAGRLEPLRIFWGLSFPQFINEFIDRYKDPGSINKFVFFLKSPKNNPPSQKGRVYRNNLSNIPGLHRKAIFLLGDLFPALTWMKNRYGCKSGWKALLYYPHRLGKILTLFR